MDGVGLLLPRNERGDVSAESARIVAQWSRGDLSLGYESLRNKILDALSPEVMLDKDETEELLSLLNAIIVQDEAQGRETSDDLRTLRDAARRAVV